MIKKIIFVFFLFSLTPLFADIVVLKDGRTFEGKIVEQTKTSITILVDKGTYQAQIPLQRKDIASIEKQDKTSWEQTKEEYSKRRDSARQIASVEAWENLAQWCHRTGMAPEEEKAWKESLSLRTKLAEKVRSVSEWLSLALWCKEKQFYGESQDFYRKVIQLDPNHEEARGALGYKKYKNTWVSVTEYAELEEKDMIARGYVKYNGQWYPASSVEAMAKMKAAENREHLKKMQQQYSELSQKYAQMEKQMETLVENMNQLYKKVQSQTAYIEALTQKLTETENRIYELWREIKRIQGKN